MACTGAGGVRRGGRGVPSGVLKDGSKVIRRVVQLASLLDPKVKVDMSGNIGTKCVPVSMVCSECGGDHTGEDMGSDSGKDRQVI